MNKTPLRIALTPGAEDGVGPELLLKALKQYKLSDSLEFLWCGDRASLKLAANRSRSKLIFHQTNLACLKDGPIIRYETDLEETCLLKRQALFLGICLNYAKQDLIEAIVTGPINKTALTLIPHGPYAGQTELFIKHLGAHKKPFMAFMGAPFMLSLITSHLPLSKVSSTITKDMVVDHLLAVTDNFSRIYKKKPRIVVLGLNPHAGENGLLGDEEDLIIRPAIYEARALYLDVNGPLPADGFFAYFHRLAVKHMPDVVVAIYHDQGLIPYKLLAKGEAVNVTLGLTIPRTSPAHGTAYDLVETGLACAKSSKMAIKTAVSLAEQQIFS